MGKPKEPAFQLPDFRYFRQNDEYLFVYDPLDILNKETLEDDIKNVLRELAVEANWPDLQNFTVNALIPYRLNNNGEHLGSINVNFALERNTASPTKTDGKISKPGFTLSEPQFTYHHEKDESKLFETSIKSDTIKADIAEGINDWKATHNIAANPAQEALWAVGALCLLAVSIILLDQAKDFIPNVDWQQVFDPAGNIDVKKNPNIVNKAALMVFSGLSATAAGVIGYDRYAEHEKREKGIEVPTVSP